MNDTDPTAPTGWSLVASSTQNTPDGRGAWYFEAVGAGSTGFTWTSLPGTGDWRVTIGAWSGRGTRTASVVLTANTTANASPASIAASGITAADGDDVAVFVGLDTAAGADRWSFTTPPANYTEREDSSGDWVTTGLFTRDAVSAGATGTLTATATQSVGTGGVGWDAFVVTLPASGSAPTAKPNSDVSVSGWSSTGASVFSVIDEDTPSDADFATSPAITGSGSPAICGLSNGPLSAGTWAVAVRAAVSTGTATLRVKLVNDSNAEQGSVDQAVTSTPTRYDLSITTSGAATRISFEFIS